MMPENQKEILLKGRGPFRRCVVTGETRLKSQLIRFVVAPDGLVIADLAAKLPGRGIWLSPGHNVIEKACRGNSFARSAKRPANVPGALLEDLDRALEGRCLDALGLARRAGQLVAGFEKVRSWLQTGKIEVLVQAREASEGGKGKLQALARAISPSMEIVELFEARQLGRALGRGEWVHVGLSSGGIAGRFAADVARLSALRTNRGASRSEESGRE